MPNTQGEQFISVTTPLGDDGLLLQKFTGQEGISQLFKFKLELASEKPPIRLESIIGQNVTVNMTLSNASKRYFNGFVSQFSQTGQDPQFTYYQADGSLALVPESNIRLPNLSEQNGPGNRHTDISRVRIS